MQCSLNRNNFTCKCLWGRVLELSERDGGLEWMRGVKDICKRVGAWKNIDAQGNLADQLEERRIWEHKNKDRSTLKRVMEDQE